MAVVFHGHMGMTDDDYAKCSVFDEPTVLTDADSKVISSTDTDQQLQKIYNKVQSSVAAKLRRDEYRLRPAKMILSRADTMKKRSADLIIEIQAYKAQLSKKGIYSNNDINDLVDLKYDELYKTMNARLDLEFPCNEESKK